MKLRIILLLLTLLLPLALSAQKLNIDKVLDGRYKKNPNTTDVVYRGQHLFNLPVDYYHSLTVVNDEQLMNVVVEAFLADEKMTADKEMTKVGQHLFFGFYRMKYNGETNRFILLKDMRYSPSAKKKQVTLIYMEGNCTIDQIKKMFKK